MLCQSLRMNKLIRNIGCMMSLPYTTRPCEEFLSLSTILHQKDDVILDMPHVT
jgi:hypothetical protein